MYATPSAGRSGSIEAKLLVEIVRVCGMASKYRVIQSGFMATVSILDTSDTVDVATVVTVETVVGTVGITGCTDSQLVSVLTLAIPLWFWF